MTKGRTDRDNGGKLQYNLIPWEWLKSLAVIFTFGAKKYSPNNWRNSLNTEDHDQVIEDRLGSLMRHYIAYRSGEVNDPESGEHHLVHTAWNALMIVWYDINQKNIKSVENHIHEFTKEINI